MSATSAQGLPSRASSPRRALRVLAEGLSTFVMVSAIALAAFMLLGPRFGYATHPVLSGSMEPTIGVGAVIVTKLASIDEIGVGDIVTFQSSDGNRLVTHRVVEVVRKEGESKPWFRTKGDANEEADPDLVSSKSGLLPKTVLSVPYAGYLTTIARNKVAFLAILAVPALALVGFLLREVKIGIAEEKARRRAPVRASDA